jgi:hypothetical protein
MTMQIMRLPYSEHKVYQAHNRYGVKKNQKILKNPINISSLKIWQTS